MNERLKQLAIEAKLIAPEYNGFDHTRLSISQQKFAELVIKECVGEFVRKTPVSVKVSNRARHVFKHFGIKE